MSDDGQMGASDTHSTRTSRSSKVVRIVLGVELVALAVFGIYVGLLWLPLENIDADDEGYATADERRPSNAISVAAGAAVALVPVVGAARTQVRGAPGLAPLLILVLVHLLAAVVVVAMFVW